MADTRVSKLNGNTERQKKWVYVVDEIPAVPDTNILNLNIKLIKIKITVVINLKW